MVLGQPALRGLLVWAVAVVAIDGALVARGDDAHRPVTNVAQTTVSQSTVSSSTTTSAPVAASDTTAVTSGPDSAPNSGSSTTLEATSTTTASSTSTEVVVKHLQGDADTPSTASFHVDGRWELRWQIAAGGKGVAATVQYPSASQQCPSFVPMTQRTTSFGFAAECGGDCTLNLTPDGSGYDVTVVDVEG